MRIGPKASVAALGVAIIAVGGAGVADAAGAKPVLLGHSNHTSGTTTIKSHGTPLALHGPASKPPLSVTSKKLVAHLNSEYVGGKTASQLGPSTVEVLGDMSDYTATVLCPSGTHPVGGGVLPDITTSDDAALIAASMPNMNNAGHFNGWFAVALDLDGTYDGTGFVSVQCQPGAYAETSPSTGTLQTFRAQRRAALAAAKAAQVKHAQVVSANR